MSSNLTIKRLTRPDINDADWNAFIAASPQGINYAMTWYLDVVWPDWQGIYVFYKKKLQAVMPIKVSKKYGIHYSFQPLFAQYEGIFFKKMEGKTERVLAMKKRLVNAVVDAIPDSIKRFSVNFAPEFDYPLPFHWAGFELHVRYSYWLDNQVDKAAIFKNFNERTRTYINKANKSGLLTKEVEDVGEMIALSKKHDAYFTDYELLGRLWGVLKKQKVGKAIEVRDTDGRLHAGLIYQVSGKKQVHLFSAKDPALSSKGGVSLAIWQSIQSAGEEIEVHDFEGSMLEPVEHFFRGFGTRPVPYLQVSKNDFPKPIRWLTK